MTNEDLIEAIKRLLHGQLLSGCEAAEIMALVWQCTRKGKA